MEGGVFAALARGALQGLERLGGGDHRLAAAGAQGSDQQLRHGPARLVEIEALGPKTAPSPAQLSAQARALREERAVAGIVRVVEAALRPDPVLGDAGENLEVERRALARLRRGVRQMDAPGGDRIAGVEPLRPGEASPRLHALPKALPGGRGLPPGMDRRDGKTNILRRLLFPS